MSVRIYQLSKDLGMDNNALIALLQERGFAVKSASSTVDNISADSLMKEFQSNAVADEPAAAAAPAPEVEAAPVKAPSPASFVRSKDDIDAEKKAAIEAAAAEVAALAAAASAAKAAAAPPPPPAPSASAPRPAGPPPPAAPRPMAPPSSRPSPMSPPAMGARPNPASSGPSPLRPPAPAAPSAANIPSVRPAAPVQSAPKPAQVPSPRPASPPPANRPPMARPGNPSPAGQGPASPMSVAIPSIKRESSPAEVSQDLSSIRTITIKPPIVVRDFAIELGLKPFKLISELMEMGIFASINQSLDEEIAVKVAEKHGVILEIRHRGEGQQKAKKQEVVVDEAALMEERPPVVCIMGHVDHGKTTLLDYIRKANVVKGEAGGITQHIGAYQIEHAGKKITFLDTPGHAAFNAMRARGADVTDVAILVVAADDGFKPQTDEALKFIQKAGAQPIIAINKIDKPGANLDTIKRQLQERGVASEDWGGQTICVPVSAIKGTGVSDLLDMILLQTEVLELKANPKKLAEGIIIEASVEIGRGPTATVIVQGGTLKVGDSLISGSCYTRVKAMFDENGKQVKIAPPSTPVRVIGWTDTPECGVKFQAYKNGREAKALAEENRISERAEAKAVMDSNMPTSAEQLFAAIAATKKKTLRVIVKADVFGSVEAVVSSLKSIKSDKVHLSIIDAGVGVISKSDVQLASASGGSDVKIVGFNVKTDNGVLALAKHHSIPIVTHRIIYELVDQITADMVDMLDPEYRENKIGAAEVRAVFPINNGFTAGCLVVEGRVEHGSLARLVRKGQVVVEKKIDTLRRLKDDVKEVRAGTECGIRLVTWNDYQVGDVIEIYEVHKIKAVL